ncbi:hypothetical protein CWE21_01465 [Pseudidiomarina aquimaris]|uniref:Uncharacterized protein n=1 Tax=Pseudidiomarina aquimaris TaxID=641841 RepID=A0A432XQ34_9GAMM|nr:hypothetical protein [Pseudidiomarina aquimaris]RUO50794.1 hypothetical protein CWE21_01465 [Pseudidiomarina aquimaris]
MSDTETLLTESSPATRALYYVRSWPLQASDQACLVSSAQTHDLTTIFTEEALAKLLEEPRLLDDFPYPAYVLQTELALHGEQAEQLPAFVLQLNDASWVTMTLDAQPVTFLG